MARGGVNKASVQTARLALMARGEHPSIDAVRVEMGNTGSKTTIHRYLKELDVSDKGASSPADINDELTELVTRLAQRLQGQAQEKIDDALSSFETKSRQQQEVLLQTQQQLAEITSRLSRRTEQLKEESATLLATRERLQAEQTDNARLAQANQDMISRLLDKDEQIRSLEEKHVHAREALDHSRESAREQRAQEQLRHQDQIQQLQAALREVQQSASQLQEEITHLNRANERLLAETRSVQQDLSHQNERLDKATAHVAGVTKQFQHSETRCALLEERTRIAQQESLEARQQLTDQQQQNRVLELILIKTELALENLRAAQPQDRQSPQD